MATAIASPVFIPVFHWVNVSGVSSAGYKLNTYFAGTNNPQTTWTDSTLSVANANPVILDANGNASVWIGTGVYKFVLTDTLNNVLWTADQVSEAGVSAGSGTAIQVSGPGATNLATNTVYTLGAAGLPYASNSTVGDDLAEYSAAGGTFTVKNAGRYIFDVQLNFLINGATITLPGSVAGVVNGVQVGTAPAWFAFGTGGTTMTAHWGALIVCNALDVITARTINGTTFSAGTPQSAGMIMSLTRVR